jgi:uncharacterized protein (DUF58 family)
MMNRSGLTSKARAIELLARRISKEIRSGSARSPLRGQGMRFSEHRVYQYGDEHRHIDWRASARTREPLVKVYEEDREFSTLVVVDMSASMAFGTVGGVRTKLDVALEVAAVLGLATVFGGGTVGYAALANRAVTFANRIRQSSQVFSVLGSWQNVGGIGIGDPLLVRQWVQRSKAKFVFVISDFLEWNLLNLQDLGRQGQVFQPIRILDASELRQSEAPTFVPFHFLESDRRQSLKISKDVEGDASLPKEPKWGPSPLQALGLEELSVTALQRTLIL